MTVWQIIIVACLYLLIGGVITAVLAGDDDSTIILVPFWPLFTLGVITVLILTLFGKIGQLIVKGVKFIGTVIKIMVKKEKN